MHDKTTASTAGTNRLPSSGLLFTQLDPASSDSYENAMCTVIYTYIMLACQLNVTLCPKRKNKNPLQVNLLAGQDEKRWFQHTNSQTSWDTKRNPAPGIGQPATAAEIDKQTSSFPTQPHSMLQREMKQTSREEVASRREAKGSLPQTASHSFNF